MRQPFISPNHQIPQWSRIILIPQLFRVFAFVCLAHQMGGSPTFGSNSLDDIMPGRPNQSQESDLKFLIIRLHRIIQLHHEFCKAPLESAGSDSCLACLPTPGPSVVPVNWLAVPGRSKKWGRGVLSVSPLLQTPAGFPWQLLVTPLIFCLPAGWRGVASFGWWVARRSRRYGLFGKLCAEVCCRIPCELPQYKQRSQPLIEMPCRSSSSKIFVQNK